MPSGAGVGREGWGGVSVSQGEVGWGGVWVGGGGGTSRFVPQNTNNKIGCSKSTLIA